MTPTSQNTAPSKPTPAGPGRERQTTARRPRPKRGEGQWALGYREPLNANEQSKKDDNPLNVRARIENVYAHRGFASIDGADLRGRFRWWGLYTQRRPGLDGGKTGALAPEELDDEFFMLRVRSDGALLGPAQLRALGEVSTTYARDTADITDRQNIQYHWVRIEDVPAIWSTLEAVGLQTQEACGDSPRGFLGSPVAGIAADEIIDGTPALEEIKRRYIGNPDFSNLPRKFKTALSGHPSQDVAPEINDVSFVGTVHPEHGPGFDLWVGGGLSTNPMLAQKLGVWIPLGEVADVWEGVISIFRDYGYRRLRSRARLKFLVADWGVAKFREVLESQYLHRVLVDCPSPPVPAVSGDHIGVHQQKDGRYYVGAAPTVGRISGTVLSRLGDLVEEYGADGVRLTAYQKLVVLGVAPDRVASLVEALEGIGLSARPSIWRRSTMACTGIEFCKLAIVDTKDRAAALVDELERRFPDLDTPISVNVNGCPNACARTQVADIGLKGQLVMDADGRQVEGFQVHLGGGLGLDPRFGKKLRAHKVTSADLDDYVANVVAAYLADRADGESFAVWVARADEELLRGDGLDKLDHRGLDKLDHRGLDKLDHRLVVSS
jgi:sulfite reductase (ferredoxin)